METLSDDFTIDLRRLRVLRAVERHGTVSAAAAALHLTASAVSQQIAGLARELGVPLLERNGRGVRLTGQARVLLEHGDVVQEQVLRARADLAAFGDGRVGTVRVGALSTAISALLAPVVALLRQERPGLQVRIRETEPPAAFDRLEAGELDLILVCDYRDAPPRTDRRFHRVDLLADVLDAVLPEGHSLATAGPVELAALADEPWVSANPQDPCAAITHAVCAAAGFSPEVRHFCTEWDAVAALVAAGAGVALIPRLAQPLRPPGLVVRPLAGSTPAHRVLFAAVRAGAQDDPAVAALLEALARLAADRPDAIGGPVLLGSAHHQSPDHVEQVLPGRGVHLALDHQVGETVHGRPDHQP